MKAYKECVVYRTGDGKAHSSPELAEAYYKERVVNMFQNCFCLSAQQWQLTEKEINEIALDLYANKDNILNFFSYMDCSNEKEGTGK